MKKIVILLIISTISSVNAQDVGETSSFTLSRQGTVHSISAVSAVIYDEAIDGDLSDRTTPTPVVLVSPSDQVIGNVGGVDFDDCFVFSVPAGNSVSSIVLDNYVTSGGNTTSGFQLFTGIPTDPNGFGDLVNVAVSVADIGQDVMTANGAGPLTVGNYTLCFLEGTSNQIFSVTLGSDITAALAPPTPVPTINWVGFALLFMMLAFVSRKVLIKLKITLKNKKPVA